MSATQGSAAQQKGELYHSLQGANENCWNKVGMHHLTATTSEAGWHAAFIGLTSAHGRRSCVSCMRRNVPRSAWLTIA